MKKHKMLWKDAFDAIIHSPGRFIAVILLLGLGTFALIGLKMTGPDMRYMGRSFFNQQNMADITVTSNYGLNKKDRDTLKKQKNIAQVKYGYQQDAQIKGKNLALRIISSPSKISKSKLIEGQLPKKNNEIAVSYLLKRKIKIGQKITVKQHSLLKDRKFKVVGYVKPAEYLDNKTFGQTNLGNGNLDGVAEVKKSAFDSNTYQVARIKLKNTKGLDPYSNAYQAKASAAQSKIHNALNKNRASKTSPLRKAEAKLKRHEVKLKKQAPTLIQMGQAARVRAAQKQLQAQKNRLLKQEQVAAVLGKPSYTVNTRDALEGYSTYIADSEKVEILASVFPVFLFAVAALVTFTTMTRFVDEQRTNIGAMKALGYSNIAISIKFVLFSLLTSVIGVALGASLGFTFLPNMIMRAYLTDSVLNTNLVDLFSWKWLLISLLISLIATLLAVVLTLTSTLREKPAALLTTKAPKNGSRILLERITPLWRRLPFSAKVTARNIFRYKSRMLMTILGLAGCTGLLVMGFGIRDSLQGISHIQYHQVLKYNLISVNNAARSKKQKDKLDQVLKQKEVSRYQKAHYETLTAKLPEDNSEQTVQTFVPKNTHNFKQFVDMRSREGHHQYNLNGDGAVISEKLASLLHVKPGDKITVRDSNNKKVKLRITHICEMYIGHYLFMSPKTYHKYFGKKVNYNATLIALKHGTNSKAYAKKLIKAGGLQTVISNNTLETWLNSYTNNLNEVIIILILIASMLAIVVIYNLTNINMLERVREISTLKVLGYYNRESTLYIYRETMILSVIGILVGWGFGTWLHNFIITKLPPNEAMFGLDMFWGNFAISSAIPLVITLLLALIVARQIRKINMLDALSSLD